MKKRDSILGCISIVGLVAASPVASAQDAAVPPSPLSSTPGVPGAALPLAEALAGKPGLADERLRAGESQPPLGFLEAIALALQNNPQRAAARAAQEAAAARIGTARSAGGPQVGLSGGATLNSNFGPTGNSGFGGGGTGGGPGGGGDGGTGGFGGFERTEFSQQAGASASLPIYTGGRVKASTNAAQAAARAQAARTLQVEQDLVLNTATAYLGILRSEQLLDVAESNVDVSRERLRVAQVRFDAGAAARLDVLRAATTLADAEQRRISAGSTVAQVKATLNTFMGRSPETPFRVISIDAMEPPVPLTAGRPQYPALTRKSGAELRAMAETTDPELTAAREQIRAAEANVDVARAQRKPSLGLNLSGFLRNPASFLGRFAVTLGLSVAQTLFDSGRAKSQISEARSLVTQARQGLEGQRLAVANDLEQLLLTADAAERRLGSTDISVLAAQEALRAAQLGYAAGARTSVEVSDAQAALLAAQTEAVNARFELALSRARIASAAGGLTPEWMTAYEAALRDELQRVKPPGR